MTAPLHTTPPERIAALHAIRDRHRGDGQATQAARLLEALKAALFEFMCRRFPNGLV